jgi:hypothetical protein
MTLPWSTIGVNDHGKRAGARLLPNTLFFDYTQKMAGHKMAMDKALGEFVQAYPSLIAIAQQKLGSSFNFAEYPRPSAIGMHFNLSFDFIPIPVGQDFNGVGLQQAEKLAMAVNKKTKTMLENAMQDVWTRLSNDLEHAYNTLANPNIGFHTSLIEKIRSHATMLSHLNVTKDDRIEELRNLIGKKLCRWDAKDIKKDDALRKRLAGTAAEVIEKMKEYCNA